MPMAEARLRHRSLRVRPGAALVCERANLKIGDVYWRTGTVARRGTKALRQDILPLPAR